MAQPCDAQAQVAQRKVIKPPTNLAGEKKVPQLPQGFGRPIQKPAGFGKQQWQNPQPKPEVQRPRVETRHSFGWYNYYRPVNPHFRYYRVPSYYPPVIVQPPVVIQPQPFPVYPGPFHGFFFHFRF